MSSSPSALLPRDRPRAVTLWDFSWRESRGPGAGYANWDDVLDRLCGQGCNAVRIDACPHLVASDPGREWTLKPVWNQQMWGSPALHRACVPAELNAFLALCRSRGLRAAMASWFREDVDNTRMQITSAAAWRTAGLPRATTECMGRDVSGHRRLACLVQEARLDPGMGAPHDQTP